MNIDRVAFTLFGKDIYWYGVLMALGIIIAVYIAHSEAKRKELPKDAVFDLCLWVIPLGIIGARLYYVLFELESYLADPIRMLYIWEGGLAIYGAVIGGLLGAFIYGRRKKIRFLTLADCIAPGLVLAQGIGRWGNFFNQEAFGLPITNPDMMWFPLAVKIDRPWMDGFHTFNGIACDNPYHLATFFYESLWCVIVFIVLWSLRKKFKHDGDAILTYAMLYGFERMFVEALRGDSLWLIPDVIRVSQLVSFVLFVAVLVFFLVRRSREKKLGALCWPAPLKTTPCEETPCDSVGDTSTGAAEDPSAGECTTDKSPAEEAATENIEE
ncbi:MAG: prolipoprotein diacylglyceryl transferase [Clostridia bacterium]|nr:prolipoprotein diacylglyceryl transferase [Clostridia bacterium]